MSKYLKLFQTHSQYVSFANGNFDKPNVSYCLDVEDVHYNPFHNYSLDYLTFVALESGTFTFNSNDNTATINYSLDNGNTWVELASGSSTPTITAGNKVLWKGELEVSGSGSFATSGNFSSSGTCDIEGNIMSIIAGDDFAQATEVVQKQFSRTFSVKVVNAKNLILPATTLADDCYYEMFGVTSYMLNEPQIPDSVVPLESRYCAGMFCGHNFTPNGRYSEAAYICNMH
jgi:hypothetical protein